MQLHQKFKLMYLEQIVEHLAIQEYSFKAIDDPNRRYLNDLRVSGIVRLYLSHTTTV